MPYRFEKKNKPSAFKSFLANFANLGLNDIVFLILCVIFYVVVTIFIFGQLWNAAYFSDSIDTSTTNSYGTKILNDISIPYESAIKSVKRRSNFLVAPISNKIKLQFSFLRSQVISLKSKVFDTFTFSRPVSALPWKYFDSLLGAVDDRGLMKKCTKLNTQYKAIENRLFIENTAEPWTWSFHGEVTLDQTNLYKTQIALSDLNYGNLEAIKAIIQSHNNSQVYSIDNLSILLGKLRLESSLSQRIILGMAEDIEEVNFGIFSGSFKKHSKGACSILFMNIEAYTKRIQQFTNNSHIYVILFSRKHLRPVFLQNFHPSSLRWVLYSFFFNNFRNYIEMGDKVTHHEGPNHELKWLEKYVKYMMVADVRDTLFQADPFAYCNNKTNNNSSCDNRIISGQEASNTIESCIWNSKWISKCFSHSLYQSIKGSSISCSGFSIGSGSKVLEYINLMSDILLGKTSLSKKYPFCEENGVDQGIHNVILSLGLIDNFDSIEESRFDGNFAPVVHLQSSLISSDLDKTLGKVTEIRNSHGLPPVVHQYDRVFKFYLEMADLYASWANASDFESHIKAGVCASNYEIIRNYDLFQGVCDYKLKRTLSIMHCCKICNQLREAYFTDLYSKVLMGSNRPTDRQTGVDLDQPLDHINTCTGFSYSTGNCYMKMCGTSRNELSREFFKLRYQSPLNITEMRRLDSDVKYLKVKQSIKEKEGLFSAFLIN